MSTTHSPTRDEAWELVRSSTQSEQLRRHMRSVSAAMEAYARRFGEDPERWAVLGLIHDWDYESGPTAELHPTRGIQMLREKGWPEDILEDIASTELSDRSGLTRAQAMMNPHISSTA